jgi:hypothetical protein
LLSEEYDGTLAALKSEKREISPEELKSIMERDLLKRQIEVARQLTEIAREKEQATANPF